MTQKQQTPLPKLAPTVVASLLQSVDFVLLDIDGVLWSGDHVFPNAPETIAWLRRIGKQVRFLSNNSTMSRETTAAKFKAKGFKDVRPADIYTSAFVAALLLQEIAARESAQGKLSSSSSSVPASGQQSTPHPAQYTRNVFVIGMPGLHTELRRVLGPGCTTYGLELNGFEYVPNSIAACVGQPVLPPLGATGAATNGSAGVSLKGLNCGAVVAGLDFHVNMAKLACASLVLQALPVVTPMVSAPLGASPAVKSPVLFIATNEDPQLPIGDEGALLPGAGSIIAALTTVAGRGPDVVCGKPELRMATALFAHEGIKHPARCLMIGDRLSTDIAFGNGAGCQTLLVLSGCETQADVQAAAAAKKALWLPHFVTAGLGDLLPAADLTGKPSAVAKL
jgi:4-nitrophenyl phosphatase